MYMAYNTNPKMPRVRMDAVRLVRSGWSQAKVARHLGYPQGTISKWVKKAPRDGRKNIPTLSSRPNHSPRALPQPIVDAIVLEREKRNRCAEVVHDGLRKNNIIVSLSSVKRTLERQGLVKKRSPWKRWHDTFPRPIVNMPGDLVQIDTIHIQPRGEKKFYVYTAIDLFSRFTYAKVVWHINTHESVQFVKEAEKAAQFSFHTIQSDNGQEFSSWFTENVGVMGIAHRHSRVRKPNDNAHIERFNRTLEEECLDRVPKTFSSYRDAIKIYLAYYNGERSHMGINFLTPLKKIVESIPSY
jgi:transposase InsO family protein